MVSYFKSYTHPHTLPVSSIHMTILFLRLKILPLYDNIDSKKPPWVNTMDGFYIEYVM